MSSIPIDLVFKILEYGWNANIIINKEYLNLTQKLRNKFKLDPLVLEYRLVKCRKKIGNGKEDAYQNRPSIRASEKMIYKLPGGIPLGEITGGDIIPSEDIIKKIIPQSEKLVYPYFMWDYYPAKYILIYWELFGMRAVSRDKAILYKQLFG